MTSASGIVLRDLTSEIPLIMTQLLALGCLVYAQLIGPDPAAVDHYLQRLQLDTPLLTDRIAEVARDSVGLTYFDGPLGEGAKDDHDTDPLIDLSRVDCVTYVEQTLALACGQTYKDAFDRLQRIRYRDGKIDFEHRNHFMVADWLENNRFCQDVSTALGVPTETVTRTISRKDFFKRVDAPELGQDTPDRDVTIHLVPGAQAAEAVEALPSPSLIVFVGNVDWLFALHCGLFIRDENGHGKLYHASSKAGKVAAVDLAGYVAENGTRYRGFLAYKLTDDVAAATAAPATHANILERGPRNGKLFVVAHRGAHRGIPENSLAAYEKAIELGCDFIEIDLRTTKDGQLVSMHNGTVEAYVTDGDKRAVSALTLAEIRALDIGARMGEEWAGTRVPTFEEILQTSRGRIGIYLDIKNGDVAQILPLIREYDMTREVVWYGGPRPLAEVGAQCAECLPMPDPGQEKMLPKILEKFRPKVVAAVWKYFSPSFVKSCHDAGAIVIVDEEDSSSWGDALKWGVDGVQTDDPAGLIVWLGEGG